MAVLNSAYSQMELQNLKVLGIMQFDYSDPQYTVDHCKKYSETTVRKRTQSKPAVFTVKIFAVCMWTKFGQMELD